MTDEINTSDDPNLLPEDETNGALENNDTSESETVEGAAGEVRAHVLDQASLEGLTANEVDKAIRLGYVPKQVIKELEDLKIKADRDEDFRQDLKDLVARHPGFGLWMADFTLGKSFSEEDSWEEQNLLNSFVVILLEQDKESEALKTIEKLPIDQDHRNRLESDFALQEYLGLDISEHNILGSIYPQILKGRDFQKNLQHIREIYRIFPSVPLSPEQYAEVFQNEMLQEKQDDDFESQEDDAWAFYEEDDLPWNENETEAVMEEGEAENTTEESISFFQKAYETCEGIGYSGTREDLVRQTTQTLLASNDVRNIVKIMEEIVQEDESQTSVMKEILRSYSNEIITSRDLTVAFGTVVNNSRNGEFLYNFLLSIEPTIVQKAYQDIFKDFEKNDFSPLSSFRALYDITGIHPEISDKQEHAVWSIYMRSSNSNRERCLDQVENILGRKPTGKNLALVYGALFDPQYKEYVLDGGPWLVLIEEYGIPNTQAISDFIMEDMITLGETNQFCMDSMIAFRKLDPKLPPLSDMIKAKGTDILDEEKTYRHNLSSIPISLGSRILSLLEEYDEEMLADVFGGPIPPDEQGNLSPLASTLLENEVFKENLSESLKRVFRFVIPEKNELRNIKKLIKIFGEEPFQIDEKHASCDVERLLTVRTSEPECQEGINLILRLSDYKFEPRTIKDYFAFFVTEGEGNLSEDSIRFYTGLIGETPDGPTYRSFFREYILENDDLKDKINIGITPHDLLDEYFSDPKNKNPVYYDRLYRVLRCHDYFRPLIEENNEEKLPRIGRVALLGVLGTLRGGILKDLEQYAAYARDELLAYEDEADFTTTYWIGKSLAGTMERLPDEELLSELKRDLSTAGKFLEKTDGDQPAKNEYGLTFKEERAVCMFSGLDSQEHNKTLLPLLSRPGIAPLRKQWILRALSNKKLNKGISSFLSSVSSSVATDYPRPEDFPWEDFSFLEAATRIPSQSVQKEALRFLGQHYGPLVKEEGSATQCHQDIAPNVPLDTFFQLRELANGSETIYQLIDTMFRKTKGQEGKRKLTLNITQVASIKSQEILSLYRNYLEQKSDFSEETEAFNSICAMLYALVEISFALQKQETIFKETEDIFNQNLSFADTTQALEKLLTEHLQQILPHEEITVEKIKSLKGEWYDLHSVYTYAAKMAGYPETRELFAEAIAHMDPPEYKKWQAWRYDLENPTRNKQIGHLSEKQLGIWQENHCIELGQVMVAVSEDDKPQIVADTISNAVFHGHFSEKSDLIEDQLRQTLDAIAQKPGKREEVLSQKKEALNKDSLALDNAIALFEIKTKVAPILENLSPGGVIAPTKSSVNKAKKEGLPVMPIGKLKGAIKILKSYLSEDEAATLDTNFEALSQEELTPAETLLPESLRDSIQNSIQSIEQKTTETDIFERYDLDPTSQNPGPLYQKRKELQALQDLYHLCSLDNTLIATNRLKEGDKKTGQSLTSAVENLKTFFKETAAEQDLSNILSTINYKEDAEGGQKKLAMVFTDDPFILMQVGKYPEGCGSCQNYEGSTNWNKALAAYISDAHIKVAMLIDINKLPEETRAMIAEKGFENVQNKIHPQEILEASIARSIVKLIQGEKRNGVFLEPTYSQSNKSDNSMDKYFNMFGALVLSQPMGIDLMRGKGDQTVEVPPSTNPEGQYEDCGSGNAGAAGMGIQKGNYTMSARIVEDYDRITDADRDLAARISSGSSSRRPRDHRISA